MNSKWRLLLFLRIKLIKNCAVILKYIDIILLKLIYHMNINVDFKAK